MVLMKIGHTPSIPVRPPSGGPQRPVAGPDSGVNFSGDRVWSRPVVYPEGNPDGAHIKCFEWEPPSAFARGLEFSQIASGLAQNYAQGSLKLGVAAFNGATAVGTLYAGIHDLAHAKTNLDRLAGFGSLALAVDAGLTGITSLQGPVPANSALTMTSHGLGTIYGVSDMILGCHDFVLGRKFEDKNYAAAGLFQAAMGAGVVASIACPQLAPVGDAVLLVSLLGRHLSFERELFQRASRAGSQ